MGLNADLKLVGNDFNNAASWMYIANLIAEFPTGALWIFSRARVPNINACIPPQATSCRRYDRENGWASM